MKPVLNCLGMNEEKDQGPVLSCLFLRLYQKSSFENHRIANRTRRQKRGSIIINTWLNET